MAGWSIWIFTIVSGGLLLLINTKLMWNNRFVTRGNTVNALTPRIFWLNRPWLMLFIIKGLIFCVSFVFASQVYFAARCECLQKLCPSSLPCCAGCSGLHQPGLVLLKSILVAVPHVRLLQIWHSFLLLLRQWL